MANNQNNGEIGAIGAAGSDDGRKKGFAMLQQMRDNNKKNATGQQDDTGNQRNSSLIEKSVAKDQQLNPESFDADAGSMSGSYNAGSTIGSSQKSSADTDGGSGGGHNPNSKKDGFITTTANLQKGSLKNENISLFDDEQEA